MTILTLINISRPFRVSLSSIARTKHTLITKFSPPRQISLRRTLPVFAAVAAMSSENIPSAAATESVVVEETDDVKFGFKRSEMFETTLAGTVPAYDRHVFLCYKSHDIWPPRVEGSDDDPLPKRLAGAFRARKNDMKVKAMLTICESLAELDLADGDVLLFPDMIKYRGFKESDVDSFMEDVIVGGKAWGAREQEVLTGSYVFVCAHNKRDRRCGVCGPVLIEKFKEEIESKDSNGKVFVTACSHIGGHKYAGNVIIFSANAEGETTGHWYGYVAPEDVTALLDLHIGKGEVIDRLWRGQMGAIIKEADAVPEQKLPNGSAANTSEVKPVENGSNGSSFTCCQGVNGVSCCQTGDLQEKEEHKAPAKLSSWKGKWEQRDILTAVAMVGAVSAVVVAYAYIRRLR